MVPESCLVSRIFLGLFWIRLQVQSLWRPRRCWPSFYPAHLTIQIWHPIKILRRGYARNGYARHSCDSIPTNSKGEYSSVWRRSIVNESRRQLTSLWGSSTRWWRKHDIFTGSLTLGTLSQFPINPLLSLDLSILVDTDSHTIGYISIFQLHIALHTTLVISSIVPCCLKKSAFISYPRLFSTCSHLIVYLSVLLSRFLWSCVNICADLMSTIWFKGQQVWIHITTRVKIMRTLGVPTGKWPHRTAWSDSRFSLGNLWRLEGHTPPLIAGRFPLFTEHRGMSLSGY